jgi:hypothetical protein
MNKFDRILWRINGVLFLGLLILGLTPLVWHTLSLNDRGPLAKEGAIVNEAQGNHEKELLHLGWPSRITGTNILRMPLSSEGSSKMSSFSNGGYGSQTRNFLFIDHSDLSSWWLFEGFQYSIIKQHDLRAELEGKDKRVISSIFEVATSDTNGDRRVTAADRISAFFTGADGKKPIEIVPPADSIVSLDQVSDTEVLIVYQRGPAATAVVFSVKDGAKMREAPLPIKENK